MHFFKEYMTKIFGYKIIRYAVIGGISTCIHFSISYVFLYFVTPSLYLANIVAFLIAYLFSYTMQSRFVFKHSMNIQKASKYFFVQLMVLFLSLIFSSLFSYNSYIKTVIVIICMPLITFLIHTFWTFKEQNDDKY